MTLTGFVFNAAGGPISGATVQGYVSADDQSSGTTAGAAVQTDPNGKWEITTSNAAHIPMDVKITFGDSVRWLKAADSINVSKLTLTDTLTVGEDDVGFDVIFYGETASANMTWDASADDLILNGAARIVVPDGQLVLGSTAVSSTAAELNILDGVTATASELNLLDGGTSVGGSITIADSDGFVVNDGGTMKTIPASDISTYVAASVGDITAVSLTGDSGGALSVASGTAGFTLTGGTGVTTSGSGTTITIAGSDASTSAKGIAQFSSDNFAASSGTITIKDGGIVTAELAADAVTSAKLADNAVVTDNITDANVTLAKIANAAANTVIVRDANSSGVLSAKAVADTQILIGDGTGFTAASLSGDATMANDGTVAIGSGVIVDADVNASAAIAISKTALVAGTNISLSTNTLNVDDAFLKNDADDTTTGIITAGGVVLSDSKHVEFASSAGTPGTDNTVQGIVIEFLAAEAITQFDAVYVSTTTGRVGRADANDNAKLPAIGIAIEAQGSAGSSVRVLTHGVYRDDGGFGGNMTIGDDLFVSETPGTLTTTAPSDDGDFVQLMGVAIGQRSAFINPDLTVIERA